jgi:hypothetical protein
MLPIDFDSPIRGVPLWLMREYLEEAGGRTLPDGSVAGDGWRATLTQLDDFRIGKISVGQVRLELSGDAAALAALRPILNLKLATRGGG